MKSHVPRIGLTLVGTVLFFCPVIASDDPLARLTASFCSKCHSGGEPKGDLRLDRLDEAFFDDAERLESLIGVLAEKQMPPPDQKQPSEQIRQQVVKHLKGKLREQAMPAMLKRLTREEYTNTINDLFSTSFQLAELLPPDPPGDGFNKWGETQRMSPHQVESYLRTARFIADRLILDKRPEQKVWEFDVRHFNGSGRGDFKTDTAFVLSTHYPWRSNLHFFLTEEQEQIFRIPEFGRYRMEADVTVRNSDKTETISVSTGDPRYPTNFKKIARMIVPPEGDTVTVDLTLTQGTYVSYTYESAATWNVGKKPEEYKGRQVAFSKVRISGPMNPTWPTTAEQRVFGEGQFASLTSGQVGKFTEHVVKLLLNRTLLESDMNGFQQLTRQKLEHSGNPKAAARLLLTSLLSSPHFIYKQEPRSTGQEPKNNNQDHTVHNDILLAYWLSYFLWNSVPDTELLDATRAGELNSADALAEQVERMLDDPRVDRFCHDFTRQWLKTDAIDDFGPDDRVHNKKKVTFMKIRELAKEPRVFFKEVLQHDLSMINFIDSDFAMVNDETAEFYGFDAVAGRSFQRVPIPEDSQRGGLIGQAGLLKLTSSKFATSPILRGTWILKNIYGQKLNPPPDLVVEEPDLRGAETVKEVIERHKHIETCNRCHSRIDPYGLALEHFDEMGRWRDEYRHVETISLENKDISIKQHAAAIDSTATLPDGRKMSSMTELKAVLMQDREQVLKGILSKLTSYAMGREIGVRDEELIDGLYQQIKKGDYSLRGAIHAIARQRVIEHN